MKILHIVGLLMALSACAPIHAQTATAPLQSPQPATPGGVIPIVTPASSPIAASTPIPVSTDPMPGWAMYRNLDYGWTIAYPQLWIVQPNRDKLGEVYFQSPETNTQVQVEVMGANTPELGWLDWVRANSRRALRVPLAPEAVNANTAFLGHPAFFFNRPASFGGGDEISLVFADTEDQIFGLHLWGSTIPPLHAEIGIYTMMLSTFRLTREGQASSSLPSGWEDAENLVTFLTPPTVSPVNQSMQTMVGISENSYDPVTDSFPLLSDDGQRYTIHTPLPNSFQGMPFDYAFPADFNLDQGSRVRVVGRRAASTDILAQLVYAERNGGWQLHDYKALFDLAYSEFTPSMLADYPRDGSAYLWLKGSLKQVLPLLVDDAGNPLQQEAFAHHIAEPALAYGVLQMRDAPRLKLIKLYAQRGSCQTISLLPVVLGDVSIPVRFCYDWPQIYPTHESIDVQGRILGVAPEVGVIVLQQPVNGFVTINLPANVVFDWSKAVPWAAIHVSGEPGEAGTLLARQIVATPP